MKKFLAILVILILVSGVMFAADVLTITSNAPSVMEHGFSDEGFLSFGGIIAGSLAATDAKTVDFSLTTEQPLGYYSIATNTKSSLAVTVAATALKSDALVTATQYYYVPYTLSFTHGTDTAITGTQTGSRGLVEPTAAAITLKTAGYITGSYWKSYEMELAFVDLTAEGGLDIPEGDYTATVTVTVTTI